MTSHLMPFDLEICEIKHTPYNHFHKEDAVAKGMIDPVLSWFESDAPWRLRQADFYEQYEFSFFDVKEMPDDVSQFASIEFTEYLRRSMSNRFALSLRSKVDITAHMLTHGQTIRIHNDYIPNQETLRLLVQLNRTWSESDGGFLMLFSEDRPESLHSIIAPKSGSIFGFEISPCSHHAVSTVHSGQRYTLVYSFYEH